MRRARLLVRAFACALLALFVITRAGSLEAVDAYVYWSTDLSSAYATHTTSGDQTYQYPPPLAQILALLTLLPFPLFHVIWMGLQVAVLVWLVGPILALALILVPWTNVLAELVIGNVHTLIAASIVVGTRWPAAWAFPLLTKVTPGVGVLWFFARREWRSGAVALGVTTFILLLSIALAAGAWMDWFTWIRTRPEPPANPDQLLPWAPLLARLGISALLIIVAARRGWQWLMPLAIWIALPIIWYNSLVVLAATIPLAWPRRDDSVWLGFFRPPAAGVTPGR
jgi:hypothetical protein